LTAAAARLNSIGSITARSSLYSTAPVGLPGQTIDQPRFLNAALALDTALSPRDLLDALLAIEREFGRNRAASVPSGPRTLDLDILLYGDSILSEPSLEIPHPRLDQRAFVLIPLNEIAADLRDPRSGRTIAELLRVLPNRSSTNAVEKIESSPWAAKIVS